jgi:hypothetical protein
MSKNNRSTEAKAVAVNPSVHLPEPSSPVEEQQPLVTFDRWFSSRGFKPHWKAGMAAFTNVSGRMTAEQWDTIFKAY